MSRNGNWKFRYKISNIFIFMELVSVFTFFLFFNNLILNPIFIWIFYFIFFGSNIEFQILFSNTQQEEEESSSSISTVYNKMIIITVIHYQMYGKFWCNLGNNYRGINKLHICVVIIDVIIIQLIIKWLNLTKK